MNPQASAIMRNAELTTNGKVHRVRRPKAAIENPQPAGLTDFYWTSVGVSKQPTVLARHLTLVAAMCTPKRLCLSTGELDSRKLIGKLDTARTMSRVSDL